MKFSTGFISSHSLLGWALLMGSANAGWEFYPENKEQLEAAALLLCNGTWPGPKVRYWEVSNITNFDRLFADSGNCNPDVEKWDVSQATSLEGMFAGATGFDHDLSKWDITLGADVSNFFYDSCPANSTAVIDPVLTNPAGVLFDPSRSADLTGLSPYIPVIALGEMLERCVCDGDLGFNKDLECVLCEDMNMRKGSQGVCVPICPPGAENYGDTCWCTSDEEEYDKYENTCICKRGAYGAGNGTCVECPEHTDYKYKTYAGLGPIEDRCECSNYYAVWSSSKDKCICEEGAYGDGGDDCDKCPKDMEADSDGPGTGDKDDRCKCKREKYTTWDDDEEECVCKEGSYEYSKDKCYECKKNYGMEGKDGKGKGDGDIYERCQCISSNAVLEDEECVCKADSYGDGKYCYPCSDGNGLEAIPNQGPGNGGLESRCQCQVGTQIIVDGDCYEPCTAAQFGEAGGTCTDCTAETGWEAKPDNEAGFGDQKKRCQCADGYTSEKGNCVEVCDAGEYNPGGTGACTSCSNLGSDWGAADGVDSGIGDSDERCACADGFEDVNGACVSVCPAGAYNQGGTGACVLCTDLGNGWGPASNGASGIGDSDERCACGADFIQDGGDCIEKCASDQFGPGDGDCTPCTDQANWEAKANQPGIGEIGERCQCADGYEEQGEVCIEVEPDV